MLAEVNRTLDAHREVFDYMEQGAAVWSSQNICTLVNKRFYELCNLNEQDLHVGMAIDDYYGRMIANPNSDVGSEQVESIKQRLLLRRPFSFDRATADERILSVVVRPLATGGHVGTFTDVTERRGQEESLRQAMQRAEKAELKARQTLAFESERKCEANRLSEFGDWLQSCKTISELYEVVRQAMLAIYPGSRGELFIYSNSRDILEGVTAWGFEGSKISIQPQDCWALRRGRMYRYGDGMINFPCNHVVHGEAAHVHQGDDKQQAYLCLPIIAHGDTVGLLHLDLSDLADDDSDWDPFSVENLAFTSRCAEQISMAVANVKLRDELHEQSTRDPLTNLFNRRYFLERCRSELARAENESTPVAVVVFDADNFKQFNDRFGHDAGDVVLCNIGDQAQRIFNEAEVTARIGGEEFAVLIPGKDLSEVEKKVQGFVDSLSAQNITYMNKSLPSVSISAGIAMYGTHGSNLTDLIRLADQAMYRAKEEGKNRVSIA